MQILHQFEQVEMKVRSESRVLESWQFKPQVSPFVKKRKEKKLKGKLEGDWRER